MSARQPQPGQPFIPLSGGKFNISLPPAPPEAAQRLAWIRQGRESGALDALQTLEQLRSVAAANPSLIDAWASLGELAIEMELWVEAFAFFRTAYHRGLDRLRASGWGGTNLVPWADENNRPFLRAVHGLMRASEALGETDEVARLRKFQTDLDPADHFGVGTAETAPL